MTAQQLKNSILQLAVQGNHLYIYIFYNVYIFNN